MLIDAVARLEPDALRCPFPAYAELRERGVAFVPAANAYLVTRAEDVEAVLRDGETFSSSNAIGAPPIPPESELARHVPYLLLSDDPEHTQRRKLVQRAFTPSRVAPWEPRIREMCADLVAGMRPRAGDVVTEVDAMARYAVPLPITVITAILGVPEGDTASFRHLSEELAANVGDHAADPADIVRIAKEFATLLAPSLASAAAGGNEDTILATIAAAERTEGMPRHDAARFVMELLIAGNITTTDAIGNSLFLLARDPELADRLREDAGLLPFFIEESLRLESPIQGLFRITTRDTELGGTHVPAGARLQVLFGAANRDPYLVERPDEMDLARRSPYAHLAFGRGTHACLGSILARLEIRIALETMFDAVSRFELAVPAEQVDYLPSTANRGPAALPLRLHW